MLDNYSNKTNGKEFTVVAYNPGVCQSGMLVNIRTARGGESMTLDRNWCIFKERPAFKGINFDDDIPF